MNIFMVPDSRVNPYHEKFNAPSSRIGRTGNGRGSRQPMLVIDCRPFGVSFLGRPRELCLINANSLVGSDYSLTGLSFAVVSVESVSLGTGRNQADAAVSFPSSFIRATEIATGR